jgi:hypothetical protein
MYSATIATTKKEETKDGSPQGNAGGDLPLLDLVSLSYCCTRSCRPLLPPAAVVTWPLTLSSHARPLSSPNHRSPTSGHRSTSPPSHWSRRLTPTTPTLGLPDHPRLWAAAVPTVGEVRPPPLSVRSRPPSFYFVHLFI